MRLSLAFTKILAVLATATLASVAIDNPVKAAVTFDEQEIDQNRIIAIARPYGTNKYDLLVIEQIPGKKTCWSESGSRPTIVEPLLLKFDFTGHCNRSTDSNGYSIRVDGRDFGLDYLLRIVERNGELFLVGTSRTNPSQRDIVIGRTYGLQRGFLKIHLNAGWRFSKRAYQGKVLGHVYFSGDRTAMNSPASSATATATLPPAENRTVSRSQPNAINRDRTNQNPPSRSSIDNNRSLPVPPSTISRDRTNQNPPSRSSIDNNRSLPVPPTAINRDRTDTNAPATNTGKEIRFTAGNSIPPSSPSSRSSSSLPPPPSIPSGRTPNPSAANAASPSSEESSPLPVPPQINSSQVVPQPTANARANSEKTLSDAIAVTPRPLPGASNANVAARSEVPSSSNYRVLVEASESSQQKQLRSLYPDAFRTVYQGRAMWQVGVFKTWDSADRVLQSVKNVGLDGLILD
ncbi:hypothetical protein NIES593_08325 [Hydrococcus rivularis NIES-593]|uniref:Sporulation protein n=1 Tax=Hydrococcus rivularis NIES-593 TaxID=1921803 RepID=A0A1U7HKN3_9CYAN|nr:DUF3747 domain-containing protein [Hydrococcus rivularis]OKH24153.1 hypothetical protein NIES593_08325 [Hydrococcus rivularis NIES-593]